MTKQKKTISADDRLKAFALYTMASHHYSKTREFERAVSAILGTEDDGEYNDWVGDGIYGRDADRPQPFDLVLKQAGITVAPKKPKAK